MSGVDATGYTAATVEEILSAIEAEELANIDPALDLAPDQPLGQINGIVAAKLAEIHELLATAYNGFNPDAAEGFLLDALCSLSGTTRKAATRSLVTCTVNLNASQTFAPGALVANVSGLPNVRFRNRDTVTSVASGNYSAVFESVDTGPIAANAGTLTVITTPVSGWNSITNPADASPGRNLETDAELRLRRADELTAPGACTPDAIRADILAVPGVVQCFVFENVSLLPNVEGMPGKSVEVVVWDGSVPAASNTALAAALWASKPAGVELYGSTSATATDSTGASQTVKFSRATQKNVYLTYDVLTDPVKFPGDGAAQIKAIAVALGGDLTVGEDVIAIKFRAEALKIAGVVDVTSLKLGFAAAPVATANLTIGSREIAVFDTSRISVNVS